MSFGVTNGTTYYLMVTDASASGAGGTLTFSLDFASAAPANDNINSATVITAPAAGAAYNNTVNTVHATPNTGVNDPLPSCAPAGAAIGGIENSVWYTFTPASATPITADTLTSDYDTILSVWTGTPGSLVAVAGACNDNAGTGATQVLQSQVSFNATGGTQYYFMVSSVLGDGGTTNFHLNLTAVQAGPAAKLGFTTQPTNTAVGAAISPSVQVSVEDAQGNVVTTATNSITVAIGANPSGGTLSGTLTQAAVNGTATFPGLSINKLGTGYTLTASATSLTASHEQFIQHRRGAAITTRVHGAADECGGGSIDRSSYPGERRRLSREPGHHGDEFHHHVHRDEPGQWNLVRNGDSERCGRRGDVPRLEHQQVGERATS